MWRFLGFFVGTGLVAVPALMSVGSPEQSLENLLYSVWTPKAETELVTTDISKPAPEPEPATKPEALVAAIEQPLVSPAAQVAQDTPLANTTDEPGNIPAEESPAGPIPQRDNAVEPLVADSEPEALVLDPPEQLHLLWSPFRNVAAAEGFARRLSRVSGVEVKVAQAEPGRYRVGFKYRDEIHKNWCLGQIQARTGLDLKAPDHAEGDAMAEPRESKAAMPSPLGPVDVTVRHI